MSISYNGLWKLLIDKNLKKVDLIERLEISSSTIAKMTKTEAVYLRYLRKFVGSWTVISEILFTM